MKKVLITGCNGFVGTHLINLLKKDYFIVGLDFGGSLEEAENIKFYQLDILDKEKLKSIISKHSPDSIIHLAAKVINSSKDYKDNLQTNLFGTLNLYEAVSEIKDIQDFDPKILFISSAEVYGLTDNPENITEKSFLNPVSPYGVSKVAADRLSSQYSHYKKLNIVVLRPFNHIGPGQKKGFFVPDMASQIAEVEKTSSQEILVGNLEGIRDLTDVRDIVRAYKAILEADFTPGDVFNICSGKGYKMKEILDELLSFSNKKIEIKLDPVKLRSVDTPIILGNHDKLTTFCNFQPEIEIEQTLKETLDYWRNLV